jgi:hypothetical protein
MSETNQPWSPALATKLIRAIASDLNCSFAYTAHARERLNERGLIMSDVLFVLRQGFVYGVPEKSTIKGLYKYKVENQSPNSGARFLRVVAIPDKKSCQIKVVTIMWRDEP